MAIRNQVRLFIIYRQTITNKHLKGAFSIMIEKIQQQLQAQTWEPTVIVAVSGGVDSVVLLHALLQHLPTAQLVVAHVNYHLRAESDGDAAFVAKLAQQYQAQFELCDWDDIPTTGVEAQARALRYRFFEALAAKYQTQTIAVAHHANDQAETVLLKLVRGGQVTQLAGMATSRAKIRRPFLGITKQTLMSYAQAHGLTWRHDQTNDDPDYTARNRLRHVVMPALQQINPQAVTHINAMAAQIQAQSDLITQTAADYVPLLTSNWPAVPSRWLVPTLTVFLQQQGIYRIKQAQLAQVVKLLHNDKKPTGTVRLSQQTQIVKSYQQLQLENIIETANPVQVLPPTMLKLNQWQKFTDGALRWTNKSPNETAFSVAFTLKQPTTHLDLRPVRTSDKLALIHGHKRLRRLAIDEKLSPAERQDMLVLATPENEVIAVKIRQRWRVSEDFAIKQDAMPNWLAWRIEEK